MCTDEFRREEFTRQARQFSRFSIEFREIVVKRFLVMLNI